MGAKILLPHHRPFQLYFLVVNNYFCPEVTIHTFVSSQNLYRLLAGGEKCLLLYLVDSLF